MPVPSYWEEHGYPGMDGVAWYRVAFDARRDARQRDGATLSIARDRRRRHHVGQRRRGRTDGGYNVAREVSRFLERAARRPQCARGACERRRRRRRHQRRRVAVVRRRRRRARSPALEIQGRRGLVPARRPAHQQDSERSCTTECCTRYSVRDQGSDLVSGRIEREQRPAGGGIPRSIHVADHELATRVGLRPRHVPVPLGSAAELRNTATLCRRQRAAWATQRESMAAALSLPKTGQAIAIDVGERRRHSSAQQTRRRRASRARRAQGRVRASTSSRPVRRIARMPFAATRSPSISPISRSGLREPADRRSVGGFAIAGADRQFVWADAKIVGNPCARLERRVKKPVAVRYAWANNPDRANLYNREGLPAAPFRTDRW